MKLKIMDGYEEDNLLGKFRNGVVGKEFKSFNAVFDVLKNGEMVTVQGRVNRFPMYKQVGIQKNGEKWIQRAWAYEY
jgi:hypothetical protein